LPACECAERFPEADLPRMALDFEEVSVYLLLSCIEGGAELPGYEVEAIIPNTYEVFQGQV